MTAGGRGCRSVRDAVGGGRRLVPGAAVLRRLSPGRRRQGQLGRRKKVQLSSAFPETSVLWNLGFRVCLGQA